MEDLKRVFSASKEYQANIFRELLAENGIESYAINQKGSALLMGEIHVYVALSDYEAAKAVLDKHQDL
jgi:hypothetical protein